MAEIVLGVGTSHTPQMSSGTKFWPGHVERDRANPFLVAPDGEVRSFEELVALAPAGIESELTPAVWDAKYARAQDAVAVLSKRLGEAAPDVVVVVGDDQRELFDEKGNPAIGLFLGEELWDRGLSDDPKARLHPDLLPAQWAQHAETPEVYPVAKALSRHIAEVLVEVGFDIGVFSAQGEDRTLGHAFTFPRRRLGIEASMVPVVLNTYYPPNVPSPTRCWALGDALRAAIESWSGPERVALVASGGLSHFVISEELDYRILEALAAGDGEAIGGLPRTVLRSGNSEILNWIVVGSALAGWNMDLVDYVPAYRSRAGTGVGMGFATWASGGSKR